MTVIAIATSVLFIAFVVLLFLDGRAFFKAAKICQDEGRYVEWTEQPNRLRLGSGFRLLKHFKQPPSDQ